MTRAAFHQLIDEVPEEKLDQMTELVRAANEGALLLAGESLPVGLPTASHATGSWITDIFKPLPLDEATLLMEALDDAEDR